MRYGGIGDIPSITRGNECRGYIPWDKGGYREYPINCEE